MSGADDYEKHYMGGEGALARSRAMMPWWFHALLGAVAVMSTASALATGAYASLATLPLLFLVWIMFLYLRVTVTEHDVHVQLGLFGPRIPIGEIVDVSVAKYEPLKYGGWGIRLGSDGSVAYSVPGHGGRGLRIRFSRGGKERIVFVTSPSPDELLAAIERARGVRVAPEVRVDAAVADEEAPESSSGASQSSTRPRG